jgi:hypothetical protein
LTYLSFPIDKSRTEVTPEGDLLVYGKATDGSVDSDEQIVDTDFSSKAIADWLDSGANVRVQHNAQRDPAGIGVKADTGPDGETWVKSLIVEPIAKDLVKKGALRAYSVGIARPKIVRDAVARGGRIVDGEIVEISLVDRPANKNCGIQLVKAASDGSAEWVGKVFGADILGKSEGGAVMVDVPNSASITFSPGDLAKLLDHRRVAEERMAAKGDLSTGERNDLDDSHFAYIDSKGGRHLPVHDAGHVKAALGRFNQQQFEDDQAKKAAARKILARAKSLGIDVSDDSNVAQAAKVDDTGDLHKGKGKKKPFTGAAKPFGSDDDKGGDGMGEDKDTTEEPDVEKAGGKTCSNCGKTYHADSKMKRCEGCNTKLPKADKGADASSGDDADEAADGPDVDASDNGDGGGAHDDDADDEKAVETHLSKSKPTPDGGAVGAGADAMQPVPAHREPDGTAIESLEHDAGLPTVSDASIKAAMRLKSIGVTYDTGALHDLLCPGYHPADVAKCYPGHSLATMDVTPWQAKAMDAAVGAPLDEATKATALWQHMVTIKGTEPDVLSEISVESHKAFQDANPGPASFPTPTELSPTSFRRAFISAGHADPGASYGGPNTATVPTSHVAANDFSRGYLDTGHAADSPSNKSGTPAIAPAPLPTGEMSRVYYRNTQRDGAKAAMQAMHDHIASTFPDLCPMTAPTAQAGGQSPVPVPVGASKAAKKSKKIDKAASINVAVLKAAQADAVKAAVAEATVRLTEQLTLITKALQDSQARFETLQSAVDALGDLPDPRTAPFKGVALNPRANVAKTAGYPAGAQTVAEIAERTQLAMMTALQDQARNDPDPAQREAAWAQLYKMNGLTPTR